MDLAWWLVIFLYVSGAWTTLAATQEMNWGHQTNKVRVALVTVFWFVFIWGFTVLGAIEELKKK